MSSNTFLNIDESIFQFFFEECDHITQYNQISHYLNVQCYIINNMYNDKKIH